MDEIDFERDSYTDIVARDDRYDARAYALLSDVVAFLGGDGDRKKHFTGEDVLDEFKERALDQYGPMTYTVLTEWGLKSCEDIGEMMFNLADSGRITKDDDDTPETFIGGYDFREAFLGPYDMT